MEDISGTERAESIEALQSAIRKSQKALAQMAEKGASTTLVEKRLKALQVGLAVLEAIWNQKPHPHSREDLAEARTVLTGLLPSIERIYTRSKAGSPQKTLLERRMRALELAVQAIDRLSQAE